MSRVTDLGLYESVHVECLFLYGNDSCYFILLVVESIRSCFCFFSCYFVSPLILFLTEFVVRKHRTFRSISISCSLDRCED